MEKSKLLDLFRTFQPREWKSFGAYLASPYFNRNEELVRLCDWWAARAPAFAQVSRDEVWRGLFGDTPRDDRRLNHLTSQLLELAEAFIGLEHFRRDPAGLPFQVLEALSVRQLDKHYRFNAELLARGAAASPLRDARHFYGLYRLGDLERAHFDRQGLRRLHESAQRAADSLDRFYLAEKLKYACAMLNSQAVVTTPFDLHWLDEIRQAFENRPFPPDAPGIAAYFSVLRLLTNDRADDDFQHLKQLLEEHGSSRFEPSETATLYEYALNYCIRQIRKVREEFVAEGLQLYRRGVDSGILLNAAGKLSPWHFKNMIKLALRLRDFDWTERFIRDKNHLLEEDFKTDALHYNLAELFFYTGRYGEALSHLNKVEFTDQHYNLGAKVMLSKIYHETGATDALESLLHAFKVFLRRNKIISDEVRRSYLNFIRMLRLILQATPDRYPTLRRQVEEADLLTAKGWLLEQVG